MKTLAFAVLGLTAIAFAGPAAACGAAKTAEKPVEKPVQKPSV